MSDVETGAIAAQEDRYTLTLMRHLGAKIQDVWAALTEPLDLAEWLAPTSLEPVVGGAIRMASCNYSWGWFMQPLKRIREGRA